MNGGPAPWLRGTAAIAVALAIVYAAGSLVGAIPYPPAVIGALVIRATPGGIATSLIEALQHWAMRILLIVVHLGTLGFGAWLTSFMESAPTSGRKARRAAVSGSLLVVVAVGLALVSPTGASALAILVYLLAAYVFARLASGRRLLAAVEPEILGDEAPLDAIRRSRRRFITRGIAAVVGFILGGLATYRFLTGREPIDVEISMADLPFAPPPGDPDFPEVEGLSPEVTTNRNFYTVDINLIKPSLDHDSWELRIHGLVDHPYTLDYRSLQNDFEVVEMAHTLTCVSNEVGGNLISTAVWRGVRLGEVLERGGLRESVVDIVFRAAEGYSDSIGLEKALEETTLVVFGMNGVALPREHGFPARIIVPGIYGMKNVKWLTEIEAVDFDYQGYWMERGWSDVATVKTQSRIDAPARGEKVSVPAKVAGVSWAGDRRVMKVEVSDDGGDSWQEALLKRELSPLTWRLWAADLSGGPGRRTLLVRATDGEGRRQPNRRTRPHPEGADGYHTIEVEVQ